MKKPEQELKKLLREASLSRLINELLDARTEEDLERANAWADDLVISGLLTQKEVDDIWDELEPDIERS